MAGVCALVLSLGVATEPTQTARALSPLPKLTHWQKMKCSHSHPSSVAYKRVRQIARSTKRPSGRKVRHYVRCVRTKAKARAVLRHYRDERRKGAKLRAMIAKANSIDRARHPYVLGGGHGSFRGPYDCSGAVSAVLNAGGALRAPMASGGFASWGRPGRGTVTVYANAGHVYMTIKGRHFGTSRSNPGGGAGWIPPRSAAGFAVVHVPLR